MPTSRIIVAPARVAGASSLTNATDRARRFNKHSGARPPRPAAWLVRCYELRLASHRICGCATLPQDQIASEEMSMTRAYNVVDADGHILEPLDLWDKYIDPEFRERRPRFVIDENGKERLTVEGKMRGNPRGIGSP